MRSDIELAREAAAQAQVNPTVARMILSGDYDCWLRISEERDSRFTKSRTAVSLIPGQLDVVDFRLPG